MIAYDAVRRAHTPAEVAATAYVIVLHTPPKDGFLRPVAGRQGVYVFGGDTDRLCGVITVHHARQQQVSISLYWRSRAKQRYTPWVERKEMTLTELYNNEATFGAEDIGPGGRASEAILRELAQQPGGRGKRRIYCRNCGKKLPAGWAFVSCPRCRDQQRAWQMAHKAGKKEAIQRDE